jgi:hypothetical protein
LRRLTGRTSVPTIDIDGEIIVGWGPEAGKRILDRIAWKKGQASEVGGAGPAPAETCTQDVKK